MTLALGVDAGGTSTRAAVVDENGALLGWGEADAANPDDIGLDGAAERIADAVRDACAAAGVSTPMIDQTFLGIAGIVSATDRAEMGERLADRAVVAGPTDIDHDCRIALAGALSGRPGIVVIAGTGSASYGRTAAGLDHRAGGWGALFGDEGSSYRLGVDALTAVAMAADGRGRETSLTGPLLSQLGAAHPDDLMHQIYIVRRSRTEIAALAPLVVAAAMTGDPVAHALLDTAARDLATLGVAVAQTLGFDQQVEIGLVGGLFRAGEVIVSRIEREFATALPGSRVVLAEMLPIAGACLIALERGGADRETVVARLRREPAFSGASAHPDAEAG